MPIERRNTRNQVTTTIIMVCTVGVIVLLVYLLIQAASGGKGVAFDLGVDRFTVGDSIEQRKLIERDGPLLFSDASGNGQKRPIFVNHVGDELKVGWVAFDAIPPDGAPGCFLRWDRATGTFVGVDGCDQRSFPADGTGLTLYPVQVLDSGQVEVDLKPNDGK